MLKSHWETWWREDCVTPQLIFTSNTDSLKDWAKSRIAVDFDVHFASNERQKAVLNDILTEHNPVFTWFAALYLERLQAGVSPTDDELEIARAVMRELYQYAERPLPAFFSEQPIEYTYDPRRKQWRDLISGLHKATVSRQKDRILITFTDDMQHTEVCAALGHLPQTIKYHQKGKTVVVESPVTFDNWLATERLDGRERLRPWWKRLWG